ncbi:MAG: cyclic nucleotide-binding domain-containing protein, partial [Alphaproteobacteria bacterium]|nr:cyclic nucleotide-binding domain-containing protein [Alphaproteobacteria bacterium]
MSDSALRDQLRGLKLFAGLTAREVEALLDLAREVGAEAGSTLAEGEGLGRDYLIVLEGEIEVVFQRRDGGLRTEVLRPGQTLRRSGAVTALSPMRGLRIDGDRMDDLLAWFHHFGGAPDDELRRRMLVARNA